MRKAIVITALFAAIALFLPSQPVFSQSQGLIRIFQQNDRVEIRVSDEVRSLIDFTVDVSGEEASEPEVRVTEGPRKINTEFFKEFRFSLPFAPDIKEITPEAPPPHTVINLITPPAPVCPVPVIQPEENPSASELTVDGTLSSSGLFYDLSWSCTGYTGGCVITKNGQDYLAVDGDGILNNIPVDRFPAGTTAAEAKVVIRIKSGSVTDIWEFTGLVDSAPIVIQPPAPPRTNAYAALSATGNSWFENADSLTPGPLITGSLLSITEGRTIGEEHMAASERNLVLNKEAITYASVLENDGLLRLRSAFQVQPGEYLWKEFKKYKLQYSYGAGWGAMATDPDLGSQQPNVVSQQFYGVFNTFVNRAYNANCSANPEAEWFDAGSDSVQFYNNTTVKDGTVPLQTLYGPNGTPEAYVESQPFTTHNQDEAPGNNLMIDFSLKIPQFLSSPSARDRLVARDTYVPFTNANYWKQKIADAICFRMVQEDGSPDSVRYFNFPTIWKDSGTFYTPGQSSQPQESNPPTISISNLKPGAVIAATGFAIPGDHHSYTVNTAYTNFTTTNLTRPVWEYSVYGKVYHRPNSIPPPRQFSNDVPARLLSPAPFQVFTAGAQNRIYWAGGAGDVSLILFNGQRYTDSFNNPEGVVTYPPYSSIGWLAKNLGPNGEILWDGKTICDHAGANCQPVSKFGNGPFYIGIVQQNVEKAITVSPDSGLVQGQGTLTFYNGIPYYSYFNAPQAGPFFIEQTPNGIPRITEIERPLPNKGAIGSVGGPGHIIWDPMPGDYAFEIGLVDPKTKTVLSKSIVNNLDVGVPKLTVTSIQGGESVDVNKPLTITWTSNKYVDPESSIGLMLKNYPDVGYFNLTDAYEHIRWVYHRQPPRSGIDAVGAELGWARFIYKDLAKAKDGRYDFDMRTTLPWVSYQGIAAGCMTADSIKIAQGLFTPAQLSAYKSPISIKDCIKALGNFDNAYINLTTTNDPLYHFPTTSAGLLDYTSLFVDKLPSNAIAWSPKFKVAGPFNEVQPPTGNERIKISAPVANGAISYPPGSYGASISWNTSGTYVGFKYKTKLQDKTVATLAPVPDETYPEKEIKLVNPTTRMVFTWGGQNKISWKGGWDRVIVGVAQKGFNTDATFVSSVGGGGSYQSGWETGYAKNKVLGYITSTGLPNSSVVWDGRTVCDEIGGNCHDMTQPLTTVLRDVAGSQSYGVKKAVLPGEFEIFVMSRSQITVNDTAQVYCYAVSGVGTGCNKDFRPISIEALPNQLPRQITDVQEIATVDSTATPYGLFKPVTITPNDQHALTATLIDENGNTVATDTVPFLVGGQKVKLLGPISGNYSMNQPLVIQWDKSGLDPKQPLVFYILNRPDPDTIFNKWVGAIKPYPAYTPPVNTVSFSVNKLKRNDGVFQASALAGDGQAVVNLADVGRIQIGQEKPFVSTYTTLVDYLNAGGKLDNLYIMVQAGGFNIGGAKANEYPFTSFSITKPTTAASTGSSGPLLTVTMALTNINGSNNVAGYASNGAGVPPITNEFRWPLPHPANMLEGGQPFAFTWNSSGADFCDFIGDGVMLNQNQASFNGSPAATRQPASGQKTLWAPYATGPTPRTFGISVHCYASSGASTNPADPNSVLLMKIPGQTGVQLRVGSVPDTVGNWFAGLLHLLFK